MPIDTYKQQPKAPMDLTRYEARLSSYSSVELGPSPIQDAHGRRLHFDSAYDLELPVLSPEESYSQTGAGFFTPEPFSPSSQSATSNSCTSAMQWMPESGAVPCLPDENTVKVRKDRRRAQNRVAQRAFRDRKEKAIESLSRELQRLLAINQNLSKANEAYAQQISDLKKTIESTKALETPPSSALTGDTFFELDQLGLEQGFAETMAALQADCGEAWIDWQGVEYKKPGEATRGP